MVCKIYVKLKNFFLNFEKLWGCGRPSLHLVCHYIQVDNVIFLFIIFWKRNSAFAYRDMLSQDRKLSNAWWDECQKVVWESYPCSRKSVGNSTCTVGISSLSHRWASAFKLNEAQHTWFISYAYKNVQLSRDFAQDRLNCCL